MSQSALTGNEAQHELQKWFSPDSPVNYDAAYDAHHEGTVAWCTQGNTFTRWTESGSLLWLHGKRTIIFNLCIITAANDFVVL